MKKVLLAFLILIFCVSTAYGFQLIYGRPLGSGSPTYLVDNGFETQDEDDEWTTTGGTPDYDYSTSGLDMVGSECLEVGPGENAYVSFPAQDEVWGIFKCRYNEAIENFEVMIHIQSVADRAEINITTSGRLRCAARGGTSSPYTPTNTFNANNSLYIKWHYKKGTGSDALMEIWTWNGSAWTNNVSSTNGTYTDQVQRFKVHNNADTEMFYFDDIRVDDEDITSP